MVLPIKELVSVRVKLMVSHLRGEKKIFFKVVIEFRSFTKPVKVANQAFLWSKIYLMPQESMFKQVVVQSLFSYHWWAW